MMMMMVMVVVVVGGRQPGSVCVIGDIGETPGALSNFC